MATTTTGDWQIRTSQAVAPETDAATIADNGEDAAQTAQDAIDAVGYIGTVPEEES